MRTPTPEQIEAVDTAFRGSLQYLDECACRSVDERWHEETCRGIVEMMREHARRATVTYDEVLATMPPNISAPRYVTFEETKRAYVSGYRDHSGWILGLGTLKVGWERIVTESVGLSREAQNARRQVFAFVTVAGVHAGTTRLHDIRIEDA